MPMLTARPITVIGIGRVGLPLSLVLCDSGFKVFGLDVDKGKIAILKKGVMPFKEEGGEPLLKKYINHKFFPTTSTKVISDSGVIILTLGTPIDENMNPVFDQIEATLDMVIPLLRKNQLLILRSTVSPKTTQYVKEKIELNTKLKVGDDIYLAFCPERIAEGKAIEEIKQLPQIVGGINHTSSQKAKEFFTSFGVNCLVTDALSAELAKLFTNMYRYISFAIPNEFMVIAESFGRNIHQIIELVNSGYKRGGLALPGLTGGPCLFKDGFFLINENPFLDLITASWKINENTPLFLMKKLSEKINLSGKKVAILGLAFKPEIDDIRESLSFKIRKSLMREHAEVILHDPYVTSYQRQKVFNNLNGILKNVDAVIVATRHKYYEANKDEILRELKKGTVICDVWNLFDKKQLVFKV